MHCLLGRRYGDSAALARLLQRGCPVDAADYDGRTLLQVAVTNKQQVRGWLPSCHHLYTVQAAAAVCIKCTSPVDQLVPHPTCGCCCCCCVLQAIVSQLLAAGANPNATNSAGRSPLLEAAMNGSRGIQVGRVMQDSYFCFARHRASPLCCWAGRHPTGLLTWSCARWKLP
jgi:hypothetical protein